MTHEQLAAALDKHYKHSEFQARGDGSFSETKEIWSEMGEKRIEELRELLKKRGLSRCSHHAHHIIGESEEEKFGIFPSDKMKLLYTLEDQRRGSHHGERYRREESLLLLCPHHFPERVNFEFPSEHFPGEQNIISEVVERDDELFTVVNSIEIEIPVKKRDWSEEILDHFGLPTGKLTIIIY